MTTTDAAGLIRLAASCGILFSAGMFLFDAITASKPAGPAGVQPSPDTERAETRRLIRGAGRDEDSRGRTSSLWRAPCVGQLRSPSR